MGEGHFAIKFSSKPGGDDDGRRRSLWDIRPCGGKKLGSDHAQRSPIMEGDVVEVEAAG